MKTIILLHCLACLTIASAEPERPKNDNLGENPKIDYAGFTKLAAELAPVREKHLVSEEKFIEMATAPGTLILDARTRSRYDNIHVKGAIHLALTDFTEEGLKKLIPDKTTRILIYCNNNFKGEPVNFTSKAIVVALNVQTFVNLHAYGYKNVYELGPLLDVKTTKIPFEGSTIKQPAAPANSVGQAEGIPD